MSFKKKFVIIAITLFLAGYGSYRLYNYVVDITIERIRKGVTAGIKKSFFDSINPLKWPGKIFKKHKPKDPQQLPQNNI